MIWDLRRFRPLWQALLLTFVLVALAQLMQGIPTLDRYVWSRIQDSPVYRSTRQDKAIALTFDTVWGTDYSQEIISVLKAEKVPATFFVAGWWVQRNPDAFKGILLAGHEVGNATQNYLHLRALSDGRAQQEFRDCHQQLELAMGKRATLFRPPYGEQDTRLGEITKALGYRTVLWSLDTQDWQSKEPKTIAQTIVDGAEPGAIVLLHTSAAATPKALEQAISNLKQKGYTFHTVSDLLSPNKTVLKGR
ncbi:MAG: polysaccharide deacetylase family protein [Bacillota bacterium]